MFFEKQGQNTPVYGNDIQIMMPDVNTGDAPMNLLTKPLAVAALLGATALVPATAHAGDQGDVKMLSEAKISLVQAIEIAEKSQGGKAIDAGIDDDSFTPTFEVSVAKDGKVYDVRVDGVKGTVTDTREDADD